MDGGVADAAQDSPLPSGGDATLADLAGSGSGEVAVVVGDVPTGGVDAALVTLDGGIGIPDGGLAPTEAGAGSDAVVARADAFPVDVAGDHPATGRDGASDASVKTARGGGCDCAVGGRRGPGSGLPGILVFIVMVSVGCARRYGRRRRRSSNHGLRS
jgi:hypothetical protein